ncbi:MAG: hypothetical protein KDA50_06720 [Rhodobacteraceae bacterium]|nr:hypothetical protein [Paracoccaceae bacterium]
MSELSNTQKRELIYVSERIKEIAVEKARLEEIRDTLDAGTKDLTESERRQRIYAVERLRRLDDERVEALALRRSYLDDA